MENGVKKIPGLIIPQMFILFANSIFEPASIWIQCIIPKENNSKLEFQFQVLKLTNFFLNRIFSEGIFINVILKNILDVLKIDTFPLKTSLDAGKFLMMHHPQTNEIISITDYHLQIVSKIPDASQQFIQSEFNTILSKQQLNSKEGGKTEIQQSASTMHSSNRELLQGTTGCCDVNSSNTNICKTNFIVEKLSKDIEDVKEKINRLVEQSKKDVTNIDDWNLTQ